MVNQHLIGIICNSLGFISHTLVNNVSVSTEELYFYPNQAILITFAHIGTFLFIFVEAIKMWKGWQPTTVC